MFPTWLRSFLCCAVGRRKGPAARGVCAGLTLASAVVRNRLMPKHEIDVKVPQEIWVGNTDLEIAVKADSKLLGRLHISRGTIDWIPAKERSRYRLRWERFAELMVENGARRTRG